MTDIYQVYKAVPELARSQYNEDNTLEETGSSAACSILDYIKKNYYHPLARVYLPFRVPRLILLEPALSNRALLRRNHGHLLAPHWLQPSRSK